MKFGTQNLLSIRDWQTPPEVSMRLFAEKVMPRL